MFRAEIVAIGTELLVGQIADTNARWLGRQLAELGFELARVSFVPDELSAIAEVVGAAAARSALVITSGGLGPTEDDLTRQGVAAAAGAPLERDPQLLAEVEAFFRERGRPMPDNNRRQADVPRGALRISNPVGSAPAFAVRVGAALVVSLPGVPRELEYLYTQAVRPLLARELPGARAMALRVLHTAGVGESSLDAQLADLSAPDNPKLGTLAHAGRVDLRLVARAATAEEAWALIGPAECEIRARLGSVVYGVDGETHEAALARALSGRTLAVLETATGGAISARLAADPASRGLLVLGRVLPAGRTPQGCALEAGEAGALAAARALRAELGCGAALALLGEGRPEQPAWAAAVWAEGEAVGQLPRGCSVEPARGAAGAVALEVLRRPLAQRELGAQPAREGQARAGVAASAGQLRGSASQDSA